MPNENGLNPRLIIGRGSEMVLPNDKLSLLGRPVVLIGFNTRIAKWTNLTGLPAEQLELLVPSYKLQRDYLTTGVVALSVDGQPMTGFFEGHYQHHGKSMPTWSVAPLSDKKNILLQTGRGTTILSSSGPYPGYAISWKKINNLLLNLNDNRLIISSV